jgi:hypothetical protein
MQEVSVPVIENAHCETMYRSAGYIEHIPNIFICAGWKKGGFDSCEVRNQSALNVCNFFSFSDKQVAYSHFARIPVDTNSTIKNILGILKYFEVYKL